MSAVDDQQPSNQPDAKPPKGNWEAVRKEPFFDLKASHWVQIILTIVLGCIAYAQYTVYSRQAGIMDEQTNISKRQLELTEVVQRPWIAPIGAPAINSDLVFDDNGGTVSIKIAIKNVGAIPAFDVYTLVAPYIREDARSEQTDLKKLCETGKEFKFFGDYEGEVLFPNAAAASDRQITFGKAEIDAVMKESGDTFFNLVVMVCTAYRIPNQKIGHATGMVYFFAQRDPFSGGATAFTPGNKIIPQANVIFERSLTYAD